MRIESYDIDLNINSSDRSYDGEEKITLFADNESLILNSVDLEIKKIEVNGNPAGFKEDKEKEELIIEGTFKGQVELSIEFSGKISDILTGFYNASTEKGIMFTTQFESSGARRAFPCFDDPGYKSEFYLALSVDARLDAISNMPIKAVKEMDSRKSVIFEKTPRMSTYLLYMGVGEFDERKDSYDDKKLYLLSPRGRMTSSDFPFEIAKKSLKLFENYFDIKYMLPKMHLISVPEFAAGAMENWGAITFREVFLSIGKSTSARNRKLIAEVIAHEIAHHWFGDLVTMKWWNDLWLNESFATFMSYKMVNEMFPGWDTWGDFVMLRTSAALKGDALVNTHPIDAEVKDPREVAQIFDEISYGKGGSILRMIESYVGEENFRNGIRKYLKDHSYANAEGSDLWTSIESVSNQPVNRIMEAWIKRKGFPVIRAEMKGNKIRLTQERFFLGGAKGNETWPIPLTVKRKGSSESILFEEKEMEIDSGGFLKLNSNQTGFYRVFYDDEIMKSILANLDKLSNLDRWGVVNDLHSFLMAGRVTLDQYLSALRVFSDESDPIVSEEIAGQLSGLHLIAPEDSRIAEEARNFFKKQLKRLGEKKKGEPENDSILRGTLSRELAVVDGEYASKLAATFSEFSDIDPDLRSAVSIGYAIAESDFEKMENQFMSSDNDEDRTKLLSAMGWLNTEEKLGKALEMIKQGKVKKQDILRFYVSVSTNPAGRKFMLNNLEFAVKQLQGIYVGGRAAGRTIEQTIPLIGLGNEAAVTDLLEKLRAPDLETGINKGLELLEIYSSLKGRIRS